MKAAIVCLGVVSFLISWSITRLMRAVSPRIGFVDKPGGRKIHGGPIPLGGGVGIFWGLVLPVGVGLGVIWFCNPPGFLQDWHVEKLDAYWSGAREQAPLIAGILIAGTILHVMGLWDDRRALGPYVKLAVQLGVTSLVVLVGGLRILAVLGWWPSAVLTILWIAGITNAFNFLDNMDGLSAGVAAICSAAFLAAALSIQQWFVAAGLAGLVGATLGFLWHNFPPAKIFMGDGGSLVIGFVLGVLTARTTYLSPETSGTNDWYAVLAPAVVLALPLYDLLVVSVIRILRGKSPLVGDTNHFSHRLVARGMSRRTAVLCIYLVTAATSVAAIILPHVHGRWAVLILGQTVLILGMVGLLEQHPIRPDALHPDALPRGGK